MLTKRHAGIIIKLSIAKHDVERAIIVNNARIVQLRRKGWGR